MGDIFCDISPTSSQSGDDHLLEALASQIDPENVATIISLQKKSLGRFEKTNEMLVNCCALSGKRLEVAKKELVEHRDLIIQMKADLESIFRRITIFKQRLATKYPDVYQNVGEFSRNFNANLSFF